MSYKRNFDGLQLVELPPPCLHLRSKAIYVTGNPDPQSEEEIGSTRFDCWCNKTQHVRGPNEVLVQRAECVEGRPCFEPRA